MTHIKEVHYVFATTTHTARLFYDVVANGNTARSGDFSHASISPSPSPKFSREER
ncbi:MAG: hypothetical protein LBF49_02275 [Puniceicoccales bacterium]|nr:hypothetical protein [Puniceicoccales bacterium]